MTARNVVLVFTLILSTASVYPMQVIKQWWLQDKIAQFPVDVQKNGWLLSDLQQAMKHNTYLDFDTCYCWDLLCKKNNNNLIKALHTLITRYNQSPTPELKQQLYNFIARHKHIETKILHKLQVKAHKKQLLRTVPITIGIATAATLTIPTFFLIKYLYSLLIDNKSQQPLEPLAHQTVPRYKQSPLDTQMITNTITPEHIRLQSFPGIAKFIPKKFQFPEKFELHINHEPALTIHKGKIITYNQQPIKINDNSITITYEYRWAPPKPFKTYTKKKEVTYQMPDNIASTDIVFTSWEENRRKQISQYNDLVEIPHARKMSEKIIFDQVI